MDSVRGNTQVVALIGELDIARKEELRERLSGAENAEAIVLDLSGVVYADSTALTELLRFSVGCKARSARMVMVVATPQLERILQYAGLYDAFTIVPRLDDAVRSLEEPRDA